MLTDDQIERAFRRCFPRTKLSQAWVEFAQECASLGAQNERERAANHEGARTREGLGFPQLSAGVRRPARRAWALPELRECPWFPTLLRYRDQNEELVRQGLYVIRSAGVDDWSRAYSDVIGLIEWYYGKFIESGNASWLALANEQWAISSPPPLPQEHWPDLNYLAAND